MGDEPPTSPAPDSAPRSLGRNIVALLSSQVATWVLSAALLVMIPRYLGPVALGQLRVASSLWTLVSVVAMFGGATMITVEVAKRRTQARPLGRALTRARLAVFAFLFPVVAGYSLLANYEHRLLIVIGVGGLGAMFSLISNTDRSVLMGAEEMGVLGRVDVAAEILMVLAVVIALLLGAGVVVVASVMSFVALSTVAMFRRARRRAWTVELEPPLFRGIAVLKAGAPYLFVDAMVVAYLQLDTLVISLLATEREIGWYATADSIFGSLLFVPAVLMGAAFPRLARIHDDDPTGVPPLLQQAFTTMLVFGVWIGLGTVVVSRSFTSTLFGSTFSGSAAVLAVFGVVSILSYQTILMSQFAVATNRAKFIGYLMLVATLASIPLDLVLVRWTRDRYHNGAIGAGLAYIVTEALQIGVGVAVIAPHLMCRATFLRVARCAVAGAALLAAGWPLRSRSLLISGPAASAAYFLVLLVLRTPDDFERDLIRRLVSRVHLRSRRTPDQADS